MRTIDLHAHCVPRTLLGELAQHGARLGVTIAADGDRYRVAVGSRAPIALSGNLIDLDSRLQAMDRDGVDVQVLSPWMSLSACRMSVAAAPTFARVYNEAAAAVVADHPDRFLALANLPACDPVAAAIELRYCVGTLGMVGAEVATRPAGHDLDDPAFAPLWHAAEELGCVLLVHPLDSLAGRDVNRHFLGNVVGNPAESTVAIGNLIFGGVLERHRLLRLCVVHGGGFAPYQVGRWDHAFRNDVRGAATNLTVAPSEWLRTMYFDTVVHSDPAREFLVRIVGADRVVLGSDYPFEMGEPAPVATVRATPGLDADTVDKIIAGNAAELLGSSLRGRSEAGL